MVVTARLEDNNWHLNDPKIRVPLNHPIQGRRRKNSRRQNERAVKGRSINDTSQNICQPFTIEPRVAALFKQLRGARRIRSRHVTTCKNMYPAPAHTSQEAHHDSHAMLRLISNDKDRYYHTSSYENDTVDISAQ